VISAISVARWWTLPLLSSATRRRRLCRRAPRSV